MPSMETLRRGGWGPRQLSDGDRAGVILSTRPRGPSRAVPGEGNPEALACSLSHPGAPRVEAGPREVILP